jgi:hypothetical protein
MTGRIPPFDLKFAVERRRFGGAVSGFPHRIFPIAFSVN